MDEAEESTNKCADSLDEFGNEVEGSKKGINALAAVLAAAGIAKTVKEIADVLLECAEAAAGFETAMAKVSTLADTTKVPLESLKAQFLELSSETGVAVGALAEAAYQALSAGVDTANVVDLRTSPVSSSTSRSRQSSGLSLSRNLPPMPIHLSLFKSFSFFTRWSIRYSSPCRM